MRDKFFKLLKRFFIVLPLFMMILQIVFNMGSYWRDNGTMDWTIGDSDFVQSFVFNGNWNNNTIRNPLLLEIDGLPDGTYDIIQFTFSRLFAYFYAGDQPDTFVSSIIISPESFAYELIIINFLSWWVLVELVFLLFRFVTFLISWVNSLFDKCFNKINKG